MKKELLLISNFLVTAWLALLICIFLTDFMSYHKIMVYKDWFQFINRDYDVNSIHGFTIPILVIVLFKSIWTFSNSAKNS